MADGIQVAATGGTNAGGVKWACYRIGDWYVFAEGSDGRDDWCVRLVWNDEDASTRYLSSTWMLVEGDACALAEAVAVAVAHVLQQAMGPGAAIEEEA